MFRATWSKRWLPHCQKVYGSLFRLLSLRTADSFNPSRQVVSISRSHSLLPLPTWARPTPLPLALGTRCLHGVAGWQKDVDLNTNPFYDKYKEKLEGLQGLSKYQTKARIKAARLQEKSREQAFRPASRPHPNSQYTLLKPPSLDSIMHTDMLTDKSPEEIGQIWREYHKTKDSVCAVIPSDKYVELVTKALHCPYFIYPLPREEGYEFMFSQFSGHRCHFTSLINYQQYQENAPISLTLTHYTDLQDSKGIVLMAGEVDTSSVTALDAQFLANQVQLYYCSEDSDRYTLLHQFNHGPETFDYNRLLEQLQSSGIAIESPPPATHPVEQQP